MKTYEWVFLKAARYGIYRIVRRLLLKVRDNEGYLVTALHLAVEHHHPEIVKLLLATGTPVKAFNQEGYAALHFAASRADLLMIEILLDADADINSRTPRMDTALHLVAGNLRIGISRPDLNRATRELLKRGAAIDVQNKLGNTPLHDAIWCSNKVMTVSNQELMQILLENNADLSLRNNTGHTPLNWARLHNCENIIQDLVDAQLAAEGRSAVV